MHFIRPTDRQNKSRHAFWYVLVRSLDLQQSHFKASVQPKGENVDTKELHPTKK